MAPANPSQNNGYAYSANNPITASDPSGDCYVAGKGSPDALNFQTNCGGGRGVAAPQQASPAGDNKSDFSPVWNRESRAVETAIDDSLKSLDLSDIDFSGMGTGKSQTVTGSGGICHVAGVYVPVGACTAGEAAATDGHVADILDAAGSVSDLMFSVCMADFANPICGSLETADSLSAGASSWLRAAASREMAANGLIDPFSLKMTNTVAKEAATFRGGHLDRPYQSSGLLVQQIITAGKSVADPGGIPGGLRWDAPGTFNGSHGTYELVVDPASNTIVHFLFTSDRGR